MGIFISEITVGISDGRRLRFRNISISKSGGQEAANNIVSRGCKVGGKSYTVISHNEIGYVKVRWLGEVNHMPNGGRLGDSKFRWLRERLSKRISKRMGRF